MGFGIAVVVKAISIRLFLPLVKETWLIVTWLSLAAAGDLVISATQVYYLHQHRSGVTCTNRIINLLMMYIVSTGLLTSIVAIVELTTFGVYGFNWAHVFLMFPLSALYAVSFLANLDVRRTLRTVGSEMGQEVDIQLPVSTIGFRDNKRTTTTSYYSSTSLQLESNGNTKTVTVTSASHEHGSA